MVRIRYWRKTRCKDDRDVRDGASERAADGEESRRRRVAAKAREPTPAGGGAAPTVKATSKSTMTREMPNAETVPARKERKLAPVGATQHADDVALARRKSPKTRAQTKAEVMEARQKGELVPAGGGSPKLTWRAAL